MYSPGLEFIEALFGCFYARIIAVPAYVPSLNREHVRIRGILQDADCGVVLTAGNSAGILREMLAQTIPDLPVVETDAIATTPSQPLFELRGNGADVAYLQYTSGSTSEPKGVVLTHANVLENLAYIASEGAFSDSTVSVSWLPHFHDMGLVYGIFQPLFSHFPVYLLSPTAFLYRPLRWLAAISRFRGTHCGGPNFAYDLCVERISAEESSALNLSSWQVAFNGAEPVRPETLERFAAHFRNRGFRRSAFYPVYGLAEATLKVSSGSAGEGSKICRVDSAALERHVVQVLAGEEGSAAKLVGCGRFGSSHHVAIVDPQMQTRCEENQIGEIWVSGRVSHLVIGKRVRYCPDISCFFRKRAGAVLANRRSGLPARK